MTPSTLDALRQRSFWSKVSQGVTGRRPWYWWGLALVLFAGALVVAALFNIRDRQTPSGQRPMPASPRATEPPAVHLIQPGLRTIIRTVGQPSFVEAYERASIYPKMTAYIEKWNLDIGDKVKKNDVLATLFVPELVEEYGTKKATVKLDERQVALAKKDVKVAEADVKAAEARLTEAREILDRFESEVQRWDSEVKRLKREVDREVVDPQVLLESQNQLRSHIASRQAAKATILKAEAELLSKKATLARQEVAVEVAQGNLAVAISEEKRLKALVGYLVLPAPFNGVITARNANTGDFVLPASGDPTAMVRSPYLSPSGAAAPIFVVDRTDIVRIFVDIPEKDANFVQPGTRAKVQIKGFKDKWLSANVTRTSWALNVKSRTLRAEIDLPNTNAQILPGMYAYAKVIIERPGVFALPLASLSSVGESTFYFSYKNGRAVRTEIQTGVDDGTWVEVTNRRPPSSGQEAWVPVDGSEPVILGDLSLLTDGEPVRLAPKTGGLP